MTDPLNERTLSFPVGGWLIEVTQDDRRYLTITWKARSRFACLSGRVTDINHGVFSVAAMLKKQFSRDIVLRVTT